MAIRRPIRFVLARGLAAALALGGAGCSVYPSAPAEPAYDTDVLPIFQAHCTRCHDNNLDGGAPHTVFLPAANGGPMTATPPSLSQFGPCVASDGGAPTCYAPGAGGYALTIQTNVHLTTSVRMPLPPAAPLDDWELSVIDAWSAEKPFPICSRSANPDPALLCP
jgi:hypothetical protein